ncbi:uncharacterized protein G2W53_008345 [Senna tora]|uniref:Uncharacterized protein n=1 Tax=Senna tora TaxID=362788 RepID=A0A834XA07_9FABA|nr:uncharacterized protein G2W53_008345 [Senna tora]
MAYMGSGDNFQPLMGLARNRDSNAILLALKGIRMLLKRLQAYIIDNL